MKTALDRTSDEGARKELKRFTLIALACSLVGIFVLPFLGIVGMGLGAREFLISFHRANQGRSHLWVWRILALAAFLIGVADLVWAYI